MARDARRGYSETGCSEATIGAARGYADAVRRGWTEPDYDGLDARSRSSSISCAIRSSSADLAT